jgi:serine/threonine protein kinase
MPSNSPLTSRDPTKIADYRLLGRLGEGGQGVVYLAVSGSGREVAVKWLRDGLSGTPDDVERFLREAQVAQRVAEFCTAQVLDTGVEDDRPFIVSEYIEGPSLQRVIAKDGPRSGADLHRLAIGTIIALAAVHEAGIVHRDFKPANVILGADGPRVIDFGIARVLDATATQTSSVLGTPAYMSPEQFRGHPVGPAADLFSWASTMVYAATGRPPFGDDTAAAVLTRVLHDPPDLSGLTDPLGEVVSHCLAKDPARRPSIEQVTTRLLRRRAAPPSFDLPPSIAHAAPPAHMAPPAHTPPPAHAVPLANAAPPESVAPPENAAPPEKAAAADPVARPRFWNTPGWRRHRPKVLAGVSVTAALATLLWAGLALPWQRLLPANTATGAPSSTSTSPSPATSPPAAKLRKTELVGTQTTVYEGPGDPIKLLAYTQSGKDDDSATYLRTGKSDEFALYPNMIEGELSPDGRYTVTRSALFDNGDYDSLVVTELATGTRFTVRTTKSPQNATLRGWSRDSSKVLVSYFKPADDGAVYKGFGVLDIASRRFRSVPEPEGVFTGSAFSWDQGKGVINGYEKTVRFLDDEGNLVRDYHNVGTLPGNATDVFSPSGQTFVTNCSGTTRYAHCLWTAADGRLVRRFTSDCHEVLGWYDESHLYCYSAAKHSIQVVDFSGRYVRTLADVDDYDRFTPVYSRAR